MVETLKSKQDFTIVLTPNRSATWKQSKILVSVIAVFVLTIAVAWSFVGAWFVLPFAGIEVGLLAFFMHKVCRMTYQKQVITINQDKITLQAGIENPGETWEFDTRSTHVSVQEPEHSMDKIKIHLNDSNACVEVGEFLNQQDCTTTKESLEEAGLMICSNKWWLQS